MYSHRKILFAHDSIDDQLRGRQQNIPGSVNQILQDQFLISSDDQIIEVLSAKFNVIPISLDEASKTMKQTETQVDVSHDPMRRAFSFYEQSGPAYVPGTKITINIPFRGSAWLFQYRTNPYSSMYPTSSEIEEARDGSGGSVIVTISQASGTPPEDFKRVFEQEIGLIRECIQRGNAQVNTYNASLSNLIRNAIAQRRQRLEQHKNLATLLDIPLQVKEGTPPLKPVSVEFRSPPQLPKPPKSGLKQEPGISDETYERILSVIRHEGRTFEATPHTFARFDEEELRDIILAHLNGHFKGAAAGEVFRKNGKTDIRIEEESRSAFVGECKVWQGAGQISGAIDQLLSYLTWRDSKAAIIVFNKSVQGFSTILGKMTEVLQSHRNFIKQIDYSQAGEWRIVMRSAEDEGRLVTVHFFALNIYSEAKKAKAV